MGCPEAPDDTLRAVMERCEAQLRKTVHPAWCFGCCPVPGGRHTFRRRSGADGEDIAKLLENCDRVLLMAATLSGAADQLIHRAGVSDMTSSLAMDALASAAIEQVCNRAEEHFRERLPDVYFTWRYSPGYGDLPLSLQPQMLQLLDAQKHLGLTVTPEHILIPRKSVTALIGLSAHPLKKGRTGLRHLPDAGNLCVPQGRRTLLNLRACVHRRL